MFSFAELPDPVLALFMFASGLVLAAAGVAAVAFKHREEKDYWGDE